MSNKNIRLNITADTSQAKKEIDKLSKTLGTGKLNVGTNKEGQVNNPEFKDVSESVEELTHVLGTFNYNLRSIEGTLKDYLKASAKKNSNRIPGTKPETQKQSTNNTRQKKTPPPKQNQSRSEKEAEDYGNKVASLTGKVIAAMNLKNYFSSGMGLAQSNNLNSMGTYSRLGIYGSDFRKGTKDAYAIGKDLGYNANDTMSLQNQLLNTAGFKNKSSLDKDTKNIQEFSKAYGLDTGEILPMYSELVKRGGLEQGEANKVTDLVSSSVERQGMQGRESEQVRAINKVLDVMTNGKINVSSEDLKASAAQLEVLGRFNPALKGEKGAELLSKAQGLFNTEDPKMLRGFGYGTGEYQGIVGMHQLKMDMENRTLSERNMKLFSDWLNKILPGGLKEDNKEGIAMASGMLRPYGFSETEADTFVKLLARGDLQKATEEYNNNFGSGEKDKLLENVKESDTNKRSVYETSKEEASNYAGNAAISATSVPTSMYSASPIGLRTIGDIGGNVLGGLVQGAVFGRFLKGVGNFAKSTKTTDTLAKTLSATGEGTAALGETGAAVAGEVGATASKGSFLSSLLGKTSKIAPKIAKGAVALPAIIGGVQATRSFIKGDKEKGSEQLGRGLGTTGGMIAGAKLGGAIGSMVPVPVLGTAAGVIGGAVIGGVGGFLGGKLGRGSYKFFSRKKESSEDLVEAKKVESKETSKEINKRENEILAWKERLLKKEEDIFDKILGLKSDDKDSEEALEKEEKKPEVLKANDNGFTESLMKGDDNGIFKSITGYDLPESANNDSANTNSKATESPNAVNAKSGDYLGKISAKYEVGGKKGDSISHTKGDYGGASYGIPQFSATTGSAKAFVNSLKGTPYEQYFKNAGAPGSKGFDEAWKAAYKLNPDDFTKKQQQYAYEKFASPFINRVKKEKGVDLNSTRALQELAFSTSVQFGGGSLGVRALGDINSGMSEKDIINTSFATKRNNVGSFFKSSSKQIQNSLKNNRFKTEEQDTLALLGQAPIKSYAIGTDKVDQDQLAFVHKDEAILNKFDAEDYRNESSESQGIGKGTVNLNFNVNANGESTEAISKMIENGIKQALQRLGMNNRNGVDLSKSYYRYQN